MHDLFTLKLLILKPKSFISLERLGFGFGWSILVITGRNKAGDRQAWYRGEMQHPESFKD